MSNNASFMKFNLIHRAVFQNILNTDSRVQQRALSILYQTISDSTKKSSIFNLTTKEIKEFTDILQVPILLPLQSSRHTETVKLAMDCLSVLIENVNDEDSLSKDEEITNTIFLSLFNLLRNPTLATILNKAISTDSATSLSERVNPITGILENDTPNNNLKASIFRLIALLADKNDLYANKIIKRALGYISSTKWSNLNSNNIHLLADFLAVIGTSCLVSDIEDQNDLRKLTNKCLEIISNFDNETVWLRALEILAITHYSMEEYVASRINKDNKQHYRLKARFDLLEDYPPILDIDFTPKLPKKAILSKLNFRLSQSLSASNISSKNSLSSNSSKSLLSNGSLYSRTSSSKLSTSVSTITQNSLSIQDSLTPRSSNSNFKNSLDVNLLYSNKNDSKSSNNDEKFTTSLSAYNANKENSPQIDKESIYSSNSSQKRFHSAGKRNNNKLPWTKASGASSFNKSSEMSLSSNASLNLSIYNDKSKMDLDVNNNLSSSLQLVGTNKSSKMDLSKNNILQTSPIRSKASLVTRTSSARQHGSSNRIISGHSDSKTSGYSSMYKSDSPTYQSIHLNNSKQPTISSLYKSSTLDGQLDLNTSINTDVDSDIATIYTNKMTNERNALMSRESGMSMISTGSTLNFDEILGSNSVVSSVRIDANNMQNGSIMTISPIKANANSPSLSKNVKNKIENHDVEKQLSNNLINFEMPGQSSKPPIPNSLLSFSRIRSRKASAEKGLRSAPSLNEVFNKEKDINNNDHFNLSSTLPATMINNLQNSPRIPVSQPILDSNQNDKILMSKSLRDRATNERKARSAGYGRSTNNINKSLSLKKSRTRSGGQHLTESSNISSMMTKYNQETNWTPLNNPDETLKLCIANLSNSLETKREVETAIISGFVNASLRSNSDENNWIITATSLQSVARLCKFHTELVIPHLMSKINPLVITFLNSIRSAISKHALEAADQMCVNCSKYFTENQFNQLIKSLFNIIAGPNNFLKDPVDKVINNAIRHNSPHKLISVIIDITKTTKSKTVKEFSAKAFHDLCTHVKPTRMLHDFADKTLPTISLYLTSSHENTRWWGKKILTVFMTISDFEQIVQQISSDNQITTTILHQVETLKHSGLGNRRVASGIRQKHLNTSRVGSSSYRKGDYTENGGENGSYHRGFHKNALSSAGSTRTKLSQYSANSLGSNHGPRGLSQITADNENIKELTESMKTGSLVDRKRAIERFCDKCLSTKQDDKRFIHDNMAKLADAYLDIIKTSNNKVNETALKGLHKCLHQNSSFHSNPAFRDHVPNLIQAIVSHLNSNSRMSSMAKLAGSALDRMIDVLDICIVFPPLANRLNYERPLQVKKVLADKIILLIKGAKGRGQLKNSIIERCALPALYSMAQVPQVRTECQVLAETILEAIGEDRLWSLADVQNKSNVLSKIIARS